jgi:hypothetical protein
MLKKNLHRFLWSTRKLDFIQFLEMTWTEMPFSGTSCSGGNVERFMRPVQILRPLVQAAGEGLSMMVMDFGLPDRFPNEGPEKSYPGTNQNYTRDGSQELQEGGKWIFIFVGETTLAFPLRAWTDQKSYSSGLSPPPLGQEREQASTGDILGSEVRFTGEKMPIFDNLDACKGWDRVPKTVLEGRCILRYGFEPLATNKDAEENDKNVGREQRRKRKPDGVVRDRTKKGRRSVTPVAHAHDDVTYCNATEVPIFFAPEDGDETEIEDQEMC